MQTQELTEWGFDTKGLIRDMVEALKDAGVPRTDETDAIIEAHAPRIAKSLEDECRELYRNTISYLVLKTKEGVRL